MSPRGNRTARRGTGPAPARVVLQAELGARWRELAAALELLEAAAAGEVGDGEELARRLVEAYRRYPVTTLAALGRLVVMVGQDEAFPGGDGPAREWQGEIL